MPKLAIVCGNAVLGFAFVLMSIVIGTATGYLTGWIVGWFFSDTILNILSQLGVHSVTTGQFGAFLWFTGGFFRYSPRRSDS